MRPRYRQEGRAEIARLKRQLEDLFLRADGVDDPEIRGDLNRYLCVRVAGFLERALISAARSLCEARAYGEARRFALSLLERAPNPRADEVVRLVSRFDKQWGDDLEAHLAQEERYGRVNALLGIRNDVAHGRNQGVTQQQVWEYFQLVDGLIEWIVDRFEPR